MYDKYCSIIKHHKIIKTQVISILIVCALLVFSIQIATTKIQKTYLLPLSAPTVEGKVAVTFPSTLFVENSLKLGTQIIGLGQHETFVQNVEVHLLTPTPITIALDAPNLNESIPNNSGKTFSFEKDGFEATRLDRRILKRIAPIFDKDLHEWSWLIRLIIIIALQNM